MFLVLIKSFYYLNTPNCFVFQPVFGYLHTQMLVEILFLGRFKSQLSRCSKAKGSTKSSADLVGPLRLRLVSLLCSLKVPEY